MQDEPLSRILDILTALVVMFFLPYIVYASQEERLMLSQAEKFTSSFVERISKNGYISREMYEEYLESLSTTDRSYLVTFTHSRQGADGTWDNRYSEEVIDQMYDRGAYLMNMGDDITVEVTLGPYSRAAGVMNSLFGNGSSGYHRKSGTITGISWERYQSYY